MLTAILFFEFEISIMSILQVEPRHLKKGCQRYLIVINKGEDNSREETFLLYQIAPSISLHNR
jgi:hypothetical protein